MAKSDESRGGGSSSVKSGTFEITTASTAGSIEFDTGLGSAVKRVTIIGENPGASTGPFSIYGWNNVFPGSYKYTTVGTAGAGATVAIGTSQNITIMFNKRPDTNNGVVEMSWTNLNPASKNGTYHWYAE